MSSDQIITLLLGPLGLLVGSLLLNYLQAKGVILSRNVVSAESHKALLEVNASYAARFGDQTEAIKLSATAIKALAAVIAKLPKR